MDLGSKAHLARKALPRLMRRARWLVRPPRVKGRVAPMAPGAVRIDEREEEAAIEQVREVMRSKRLFRFYGVSGSPFERSKVAGLEREFAARMHAEHALAVNSGTSALLCGLVGMGIGPGDEVIIPAYTWFSTASTVLAAGAVPVVAEVDESLTIDPADVESRISPHTRAIVAVHMRGAPADLDRLVSLARDRDLRILEDVAQAAGGSFAGRRLGSIGDAAAFSFQMSKTMTAGEGGMLTTDDAGVHRRAAMLHDSAAVPDIGISTEEWLPGLGMRMSELHAAILLVQLERLDGLVTDMRARKARLKGLLDEPLAAKGIAFRTINDPDGDTALAVIFFLPDAGRTKQVVAGLVDQNIPASRLYQEGELLPRDYVDLHAYPQWAPLLDKRTWSAQGGPWRWHPREIEYRESDCPATIDLLRRAVHIDVSPELSDDQVEQMAAGIAEAVEKLT